MSNIKEQIKILKEKIASWRNLREDLGDEVVDPKIAELEAKLQPLLETAGGAAVLGDVSTQGGAFIGRDQILATLADHSVIIGGNAEGLIIITGDGNRVTLSPDEVPLDLQLQAYYHSLAIECRRLPLGVVDPNFADPLSQDNVSLNEVYIDLHVVSGLKTEDKEEGDMRIWGLRLARGEGGERLELLKAIARPEARLLTLVGDPGSGKTTFTNYLTYLLTESLENGLPNELKGLLPVRLILRHTAKYLPTDGARGTAGMLWNAIQAEVASRVGDAAALRLLAFLQAQVGERGGLFLLDGLDEVPEADRRRKCLLEAIQDLAANLPAKSRVLLTARPYAYADPKWRLPKFDLLALAPFDEKQVLGFVERWYQAVSPVMGWDENTAADRGVRLAQGIRQKPYLADIASRPLLLTLMATLDSSWGKLPEDRADLYEESVKLLLSRWQRVREVRNAEGKLDWEPSITKALGIGEEKIRSIVEKLAYEIHLRQASDAERDGDSADIPRGEILAVFCSMLPDNFNADLLLKYLETRSGLLMGRRENIFAFPHRSFQEYLAACHLASVEQDFGLKLRDLVYDDLDWWREVFLLGVGKKRLGGLGGAVGIISTLLSKEVAFAENPTDQDWRAAGLSGEALLEMRLQERAPGKEAFQDVTDRVSRWLVQILEQGLLTPAQRLQVGDTLGRLGDPRFDEVQFGLPLSLHGEPEKNLGFVHISAGKFLMGSEEDDEKAYKDERPQHSLELPEFYMARYPVTNAQYRFFIDAGGYEKEKYWTPEGWAWREGANSDLSSIKDEDLRKAYQNNLDARPLEKRNLPYWWNDLQWGAPTRPVVGVCWHESMAYSRWLGEALQKLGAKKLDEDESQFWQGFASGRLQVTLPTEAQWEKAARGAEGLRWGWGNDWQEDHANTEELNLKETSSVGIFPKGRSPYGLLDMNGNIWEWTHSIWGKDVYNAEYNYPYQAEDGRENEGGSDFRVLRGGSWINNNRNARSASRYGDDPDFYLNSFGFRVVVSLAILQSS